MHSPELLDVWPDQELGATFLTSYVFDATFFERFLLPELERRGAFPIAVFVDRSAGYDPTFDLRTRLSDANCNYRLVPVDVPGGVFHPKVHLFAGANVAVVGSGNLTPGGFGFNLEAFDALRAATDGTAIAAVRNFVRLLIEDARASVPASERPRLAELVAVQEDPVPSGDATFLHTLSQPLLPQLRQSMAGEATFGRVVSPFYDPAHQATRRLAAALGVSKLELVAARQDPPTQPPRAFKTGFVDSKEERYLHAKVLHLRGPETSTLVVGSANLTSRAWLGSNVEAVVVRQSMDPAAFEKWLSAVGFDPNAWNGSAHEAPEDVAPSRGKRLLLVAAELRGRELRIHTGPLPEDVQFAVEDGDAVSQLTVTKFSESLSTAELAQPPADAFILRADAHGYATTRVWVFRPHRLAMSPRFGRLRAAFTSNGVGVDAAVRQDILTCIAELFSLLHSSIRRHEDDGAHGGPLARTSGDRQPEQEDAASANPMETVDVLLLERPLGADGLTGSGPQILKWIDVALGIESSDSEEEPSEGEEPDNGDEASDRTQDSAARARSHAAVDLVERAAEVAEGIQSRISLLLEARRSDAIIAYEAALRMLDHVAEKSPDHEEDVLRRRISLVASAFGSQPWPETSAGWALTGMPWPDVGCSLNSLLKAVGRLEVMHPEKQYSELDAAHRCVHAMARVDGAEHVIDSLDPDLRAIFESLRARRGIDEEAQEMLEPLWAYDHASARLDFLKKEERQARLRFEDIERRMFAYSHRSATYKEAAEMVERERTAVAVLAEQLVRAVKEKETCCAAVIDAPVPRGVQGGILEVLAKCAPSKKTGRRVARIEDGVCTSCNMRLPAAAAVFLGDPRYVQICPCGALLATGRRDANV